MVKIAKLISFYSFILYLGKEDGLGVECLSGSASLANIFDRAFDEGFTITYATGRTVGIGAYLARLGRR